MINIYSIIATLSPNEQQQFTSYLKQKNKRLDTKNIQLFKLLLNGVTDPKTICKTLYKKDNRNAYHALRKRLTDALVDFIANKNLEDENSVDMQVIKLILASRTFLLQKNYSTAYKLLDRAEALADEHSLFPILNEIYHTKIQYAPNYDKVDLDVLIIKQKNNKQKHLLEDQLNVMYAKLKSRLKTLNQYSKPIDFEHILKRSLADTNIVLHESLSFKSLYQILAIANISAFVSSNYDQIKAFALKSYNIVKNKKETNKQLFYQIHIVYFIANTLFRNKKFKASLAYIDEMQELMLLKRRMHYNDFILKHTLIKALNLNYSNQPLEAIELISSTLSKKHKDVEGVLDLRLTLLMCYFQQENFSQARTLLSQFYHTDQWYIEKASLDWVVKKNITELLLYAELQEDDLFFSRLKSFRKHYNNYLKDTQQSQLIKFLKLTEQLYLKPDLNNNENLINQVRRLTDFPNKKEDIFTASIFAWLKSNVENVPIYDATLSLLNVK